MGQLRHCRRSGNDAPDPEIHSRPRNGDDAGGGGRHDDCRTYGAWQVGARFSYADLSDKGIDGGKVYDMTLGLNWFLNPNMKMQMNYILERRDAPNQLGQFWINGVGLIAGYDF